MTLRDMQSELLQDLDREPYDPRALLVVADHLQEEMGLPRTAGAFRLIAKWWRSPRNNGSPCWGWGHNYKAWDMEQHSVVSSKVYDRMTQQEHAQVMARECWFPRKSMAFGYLALAYADYWPDTCKDGGPAVTHDDIVIGRALAADWMFGRASLYDEEDVEGFIWYDPTGKEMDTSLARDGEWSNGPELPDCVRRQFDPEFIREEKARKAQHEKWVAMFRR